MIRSAPPWIDPKGIPSSTRRRGPIAGSVRARSHGSAYHAGSTGVLAGGLDPAYRGANGTMRWARFRDGIAPARALRRPAARVLHVAEAFGGGLMEMVIALAEGSAARGHEVTDRLRHPPGDPRRASRPSSIPASSSMRCPGGAGPRAPSFARPGRSGPGDDWAPDVVHLHSSFAGAVGALVVDAPSPTVYSPNAFASALPEGGRLRRRIYRGPSA